MSTEAAPAPAPAAVPPPPPTETTDNSSAVGGNLSIGASESQWTEDRVLHAHIECSQGVSTYCILEAALGIARDLGAQHRWIDELEDIMPRIFPGMLKNCYLRDSGNGKVAAAKVDFIPRKISVYLDALNSADQNLLLSPWVRENSKAVLRELIDPARPAKADPVSFSVGHIVAALWCLDRLRVRSLTCSPVPWSSKPQASISPTRLLKQSLFVGLPTHFDAESYTKRTTGDGLALLRVLTGVARNPSLPISREPPAMILRAAATGSDDGSADDIIQIGLTVGELSPASSARGAVGGGGGSATAADITAATRLASSVVALTSNPHQNWDVSTELKQVEANLDDMTPEHLSFAMDLLLQEGAVDVWITPVLMKKGRPAHTLHCLCHQSQINVILECMFKHTSTLGIRIHDSLRRVALRRQVVSVQLGSAFGGNQEEAEQDPTSSTVDVKIGYLGDQVVSIKPEFDHCYRIATRTGQPISQVANQAIRKAEATFARGVLSSKTNKGMANGGGSGSTKGGMLAL